MANIKSQMKRNRQTVARRSRNRAVRSELKTRVRRVEEAVAAGDAEAARSAYRNAQRRIDKAVTKGVIKKNTAARRKARLAAQVDNLGS